MAGGGQSRTTGHQLRIMHWNAEGVRNKTLELQQFLKSHEIDVCCIQETSTAPAACQIVTLIVSTK